MNSSRLTKTTALLATASLFVGCVEADPGVDLGEVAEVIEKRYDDPDIISVKPLIVDPAKFYLTLFQCGISSDEVAIYDGNCISEEVKVRKSVFDNSEVGDVIVVDS